MLLSGLFLVVLALAVYAPTLRDPLSSDDYAWCWLGSHSGSLLSGLRNILGTVLPDSFRPIPLVVWWAQCNAFGDQGFVSHVFNVCLHATNSFLLFILLLKMGIKRFAAYAAAVLFVLTPIAPELVTYSSGRVDLLGLTFMLLCFIAYLRFVRTGSRFAYGVSLAAFTAALLCKEEYAIMVVMMPLLEIFYGRRTQPAARSHGERPEASSLGDTGASLHITIKARIVQLFKRMLPFTIPSMTYVLSLRLFMKGFGGDNIGYFPRSLPRLIGLLYSVRTVMAPLNDQQFTRITIHFLFLLTASMLLISMLMILRKQAPGYSRRAFAFMAVLAMVAPLPTYQTTAVLGISNSLHDSHFLFLSSMSLIVIICIGFDAGLRMPRWRWLFTGCIFLLAGMYLVGIVGNNRPWEEYSHLEAETADATHALLPAPPLNAKLYYRNLPIPDRVWIFTTLDFQLCFQYLREDIEVVKMHGETAPPLSRGQYLFTLDQKNQILFMQTSDGQVTEAHL